jgi:hypothetical protein
MHSVLGSWGTKNEVGCFLKIITDLSLKILTAELEQFTINDDVRVVQFVIG